VAFWRRKRAEPVRAEAQRPPTATFDTPPPKPVGDEVGGEVADELSWVALRSSSDLFSWFGLTAAPLRKYDPELNWVSAQPNRFREFVDLRFGLDAQGNVVAFQIAFDRAWLDGPATAMTTAADLAKSVLASVAPVDPALHAVANDLMLGAAGASKAPVITAGPPRSAAGGPEIGALVDAFTNQDAPSAVVQGRRQLSAQNVRAHQRLWFILSWGAPGEPPAETFRVTATIPVLFGQATIVQGIATRPVALAVDPGGRAIYSVGERFDSVSLIDADTHTVTGAIHVGESPCAIAVDRGTGTIYIAKQRRGSVSVIDPETREVTATIPMGGSPSAMAVDPTTHQLYIGNRSDATVSVIDANTREITASMTIDLSSSWMMGMTIALDPVSRTVYVAASSDYSVWAFNCDTGARLREWTLSKPPPWELNPTALSPVGGAPMALATDPDSHVVYLALADEWLLVIDPSFDSDSACSSIRVGRSPRAVAVDPDLRAVYVANQDDNTVSVVDSVTRVVTATIPVGQGPCALAVDPTTHIVYAANRDDSTVSVIAPAG
jgi:YVTN family beta-propeller protein